MSWIQKLYETYENCQAMIGYSGEDATRPLLPICHITATAHVEIVLDGKGNFLRARLITEKTNTSTIIPCTEGSGSRSGSKPECHPLCDQVQYVAGDFIKYGGTVTSGFNKNPEEPHRNYIKLLSTWCNSKYSHPKAVSVYQYVTKDTTINDLLANQILIVGHDGKFLSKRGIVREKAIIDIFSVVNSQSDVFIRWIVEEPGSPESKVWNDITLWESWKNYYLSTRKKGSFCFVSGKNTVLTNNHPKYIRARGDGAKLISSNDKQGFTYRGRFLTDEQACNVGLETSQKAHNALSWLIGRQGYRKEYQAIVAWATSGSAIPSLMQDPLSILDISDLPSDVSATASTAQEVAFKLKTRIAGYKKELGDTSNVVVLALDSATPGRLAMTYYRELTGSDFLQRINEWYETCAWLHRYGSIDVPDAITGKITKKHIPFIGPPSPGDIAEAAYGRRIDDNLRKATINRLLPCIIEGRPIPRDLVESTVRRACNRIALDKWEWNKTLSIACALYKKHKQKENFSMTLDPDRKTRDYLYGRLLALAESLEQWALSTAQENRETNAARLMQRFAERPYSTWRTIELALTPYKARLGGKSKKRQRMIDEVIASFNGDDFINDRRLTGEFLLGYHCQREYLWNLSETNKDIENGASEPA